METKDAGFWDDWWKHRLLEVASSRFLFPGFPGPIGWDPYSLYRLVNRDDLLATVMSEQGLRTILCVGNGISQEPRALAAAGFDVTALDISSVAVSYAKAHDVDVGRLGEYCSPMLHRPGGRVEFVVGDLLDSTVCPGPFDVVIERRTVQWFTEHERASALSAIARRLSRIGIFISQCLDDPFPSELGWSQHRSGLFHASEFWFREQGWVICDDVASPPRAGRVAWLVRCGSMKTSPQDKDCR
jgi:SAM-dependent methyltransferase